MIARENIQIKWKKPVFSAFTHPDMLLVIPGYGETVGNRGNAGASRQAALDGLAKRTLRRGRFKEIDRAGGNTILGADDFQAFFADLFAQDGGLQLQLPD